MKVEYKDFYDWQKEIVNHKGNVAIKGGRQDGKTVATAKRIHKLAEEFPKSRHLIIAASERQENYLYEQVCDLIGRDYVGRKTLKRIEMKNGTIIFKFPVGTTGMFLEGLASIDFLHADEAIHINWRVWDSILPMLAEPRKRGLGWITLLSATRGKPKGYFFDSFSRKDFLQISVKSEDCPHISKEFLKEELERLGPIMYGVIYNGDFSEEGYKYFSSVVIKKNITFKFWSPKEIIKQAQYYLGLDPAGMGKSEAAFVSAQVCNDRVKIVHNEVLQKSSTLELLDKTKKLNTIFNYKKIFIDPRGLGFGITDLLIHNFKRKVRPLDNAEAGRLGKILKEDLYSNALVLLELGKVDLPDDDKFIKALCDVEVDVEGKIKGTDLSEAFVRAVFGAKEKSLKVKIITF